MLPTGEVKILDVAATAASTGVVILGKLQISRTRFRTVVSAEVENVELDAVLTVSTQASLDGKTFTDVPATLKDSAANIREYGFRSTAMNHSLVFIGRFNLVTVLFKYFVAGRR